MIAAENIIAEAWRVGVTLRRSGDKIVVSPASRCPSYLIDAIRQHKPSVIGLLESEASDLLASSKGWLCVARQILAGEFDGCDRSTRESLTLRLRSIPHMVCREALKRITPTQDK